MKVGFIGLGVMGYPMAGHLQQAGHEVTVFNRSQDKAQRWVTQYQGELADCPRAAAVGASLVMVCVGADDDVRAVVLGDDGALAGLTKGSVLIDHTTASPALARELATQAAPRGIGFVDAPVSGGQLGAENGQLTIMCGGEQVAFGQAEPVLQCYARRVARLGDVGAGQLTKAVNQVCLAGLIEGLAEGLNFATRVGLDPQAVVDVIGKGAAQSWQMDNRHQTMISGEYEHGFAVDWMRKDLAIALAEAERVGADLPVTAQVDGLYAQVQAMGGGRWDTSSLLARLQRGD